MEATKTTSTKTIVIYAILLILAIIFWKWSMISSVQKDMTNMSTSTGTQQANVSASMDDAQLDSQIEASLASDSEVELKGIDQEFK